MATTHDSPGSLVRLWGIKTTQLPTSPVTGSSRGDQARDIDELAQFIGSLLKEAIPFINHISPKETEKQAKARAKRWKPKGSKFYTPTPASKTKVGVELFERVIKAGELKDLKTASPAGDDDGKTVRDETWICRRSMHLDKKEPGTASWEEFRESFMEKHPETEKLFTPSVISMEKRVVWDCEGVPPQTIANGTWSNFSLCVLEARHRVGKPLKDRTFPILQMTCSAMEADNKSADTTSGLAEGGLGGRREFIVISVTIPDWFGSQFRKEHAQLVPNEDGDQNAKDTVIASYASIERIRQLGPSAILSSTPAAVQEEQAQRSGSNDDRRATKGEIEWLMALTSDAGGILPMFVQNLAVPGQIAKDVPLFLGWIAKERDKKT